MFARPKTSSKPEHDPIFRKFAKEIVKKTSPSDDDLNSPSNRSNTSLNTQTTSSTARTGDSMSYYFNLNDNSVIPVKNATRMYRVLGLKEDKTGKKTLFDIIDGRIYCQGFTYNNRICSNVILFDSKQAALSERFPANQAGASHSGNGIYPRILVAFDAWGTCRKRYGGGSSYYLESARAMNVIQVLDPPHPVSKRLCDRYVEPYFYTPADKSLPNRKTASKGFKVNRFFTNN